MLVRDFNEILLPKEKQGGREQPQFQMNNFRKALHDCRLSFTRFIGYPFTWVRSFPYGSVVEERLDKCVANGAFFGLYSYLMTNHLVAMGSDHYSIFVEACVDDPEFFSHKKRSIWFHFEEIWTNEQEFEKVIRKA